MGNDVGESFGVVLILAFAIIGILATINFFIAPPGDDSVEQFRIDKFCKEHSYDSGKHYNYLGSTQKGNCYGATLSGVIKRADVVEYNGKLYLDNKREG